MDLAWQL